MTRMLFNFIAAVAALTFSLDAYSASCNRKAQSHQSKASSIYMMLKEFKQIPTKEDEEFVLCMIEEKEDKEDFQKRILDLKVQKRNLEARQAQERARAAEQQQRDQQIANQRAQAQAAREAQAERRIVLIEGTTNGYDGYYLGRVTSEDIVFVEPVKGRYSSVNLVIDHTGYNDMPRPRFSPGEKIPNGQMGGTGVILNSEGSARMMVSHAAASLPPGRLANAQLKFSSADNMQIRVTILCVHVANSVPCKDRDAKQKSTAIGGISGGNSKTLEFEVTSLQPQKLCGVLPGKRAFRIPIERKVMTVIAGDNYDLTSYVRVNAASPDQRFDVGSDGCVNISFAFNEPFLKTRISRQIVAVTFE